MKKYFFAFSCALESRDLFLKKGPGCGEQSVTHNWQALVDGLQRFVFDPEDPDNQTRFLLLDFKAGRTRFTLACAHCLGGQTHVWPDAETFCKGQQTLSNKSKIKLAGLTIFDFVTREERGTGRPPTNDGRTGSRTP